MKIALDVMGGDYSPDSTMDGAFDALSKRPELELILLGPEDVVRSKMKDWDETKKNRIQIVHCTEVIGMDESPVQAIRQKKDSGIVRGAEMVSKGEADAFVSAGSTGAVLAAGQLKVGRIKGVQRAPLATPIPTAKGICLFMDCGANVDAKPEWLCQYAVMGTIYMKKVMGYQDPVVKLVNLGTEEEKGNALTKATHPMMQQISGIRYGGFVESRDVVYGETDIAVADAFTGNAIIKTIEGTAKVLTGMIKDVLKTNTLTKLAALAVMKPLKGRLKAFDASEHGGAILLGLKGPVIKCHGNANRTEIMNAIFQAAGFVEGNVTGLIEEAITANLEQA